MYPYHYAATDTGIEFRLEARTSHRFHCVATLPNQKGDGTFGELFLPRSSERAPLAILVPGFGDESAVPCLLMARHLVKQGIAAFTLYTVFHSRRIPQSAGGPLLPSTAAGYLEGFGVSVNDVRCIVEWSAVSDEVDGQRIALIGASMGGMISAIAMSLEPRISAGVFMVTGGNLEEMSWSGARDLRMGHQCTREECREIYHRYPQFLEEVARKGLPNVTPAKECFLFDPLTFTPNLRGRPILMLSALEDEIVPRCSTTAFWEACGQPQIVWLPTNHTGIYTQQSVTHKEVTDFLKSAFAI